VIHDDDFEGFYAYCGLGHTCWVYQSKASLRLALSEEHPSFYCTHCQSMFEISDEDKFTLERLLAVEPERMLPTRKPVQKEAVPTRSKKALEG
jgi:hypothetical protein